MSEEIIYKKGDKVVFKSQASWGHVWIVKAVNLKQKRCSLRRVTPDYTFEKSAAFKFLMLEADLPRRVTTERLVKRPVKKALEILNLTHCQNEVSDVAPCESKNEHSVQ